jgi:hypothetical protein
LFHTHVVFAPTGRSNPEPINIKLVATPSSFAALRGRGWP